MKLGRRRKDHKGRGALQSGYILNAVESIETPWQLRSCYYQSLTKFYYCQGVLVGGGWRGTVVREAPCELVCLGAEGRVVTTGETVRDGTMCGDR